MTGDAYDANVYTQRWFATFLETIPPERTEAEVAFLRSVLPAEEFPSILDLACGPGRHALPLARSGYCVTGWDLDAEAIAAARFVVAAGNVPNARFERRDLRTLDAQDGPFDAVVILWASFGWYDEAGNLDVLRRVRAALRPGGRLVLDIYDADFFAGRTGQHLHARGGTGVREYTRLDGDRLSVELRYRDGASDRFEWQIFTPSSIVALARRAGLETVTLCAGFDLSARPAGMVPRMQVVLERSAARSSRGKEAHVDRQR